VIKMKKKKAKVAERGVETKQKKREIGGGFNSWIDSLVVNKECGKERREGGKGADKKEKAHTS
jgi:hypothetical protein